MDETTKAIVLAFAIGDEPAEVWHAAGAILDWNDAPENLRTAVESGMTLAAWNTGFDLAIWNYATIDFPFLAPDRVIDVMAQAMASNLPADLEGASTRLGGGGKQKDGKALIRLFCVEGAAPDAYPDEWQRFLDYAARDIEAMREVYRRTRPLPMREWAEYRAMEAINQRGIGIDVAFAERAAALAAEDRRAIAKRLTEITAGAVTAVTQVARLANWIHSVLPDAEARAIIETGEEDEEPDMEGEVKAAALTLQRGQIAKLTAYLVTKREREGLSELEELAFEAATLREFGGSAAPAKFGRLVAQHVGGIIRGQFVFNGAGQTGRASSRGGAQLHNLTRDTLGPVEASLIDAVAEGCGYAEFAAMEPTTVPVARKLALLVRPTLIAQPGNTFVWSDWKAIEARVLPWLADNEGGRAVLAVFEANDADPALPDIYMHAAADILGKDPMAITKTERQQGKVATLALGFSGARRALQAMAANYRLFLGDEEANEIVARWRAANPWAVAFWGKHDSFASYGLWGAAMTAWEAPGAITEAGRVAFAFDPDYLDGTLFMALPSGRLLSYPGVKWRTVAVLDDKGRETGEFRDEVSFRRSWGRARLYRGTLCENCVQATAADILRGTLARLEEDSRSPGCRSEATSMTRCWSNAPGPRRRGARNPSCRHGRRLRLVEGPAAGRRGKSKRVVQQE